MKKLAKKIMVISLSAIALFQVIDAKTFKDMTDKSGYGWANEYVSELTDKGFLTGYSDGTFKPQRPVSFLETMKIIESLGIGTVVDENSYDISSYGIPSWANSAILYNLKIGTITLNTLKAAKEKGFIEGKIYPTRASIAAYFGRALGTAGMASETILTYKDLKNINPETLKYLPGLVSIGIFEKDGSDGIFNGKKYIRRAEMAVLMKKTLNYKDTEDGFYTGNKNESYEVIGTVKSFDRNTVTIDVLGSLETHSLGFEVKENIVGQTIKLQIVNNIATAYQVMERSYAIETITTKAQVIKSIPTQNGYVLTFKNLENNTVPKEFDYFFSENLTGTVTLKVTMEKDSIVRIEK